MPTAKAGSSTGWRPGCVTTASTPRIAPSARPGAAWSTASSGGSPWRVRSTPGSGQSWRRSPTNVRCTGRCTARSWSRPASTERVEPLPTLHLLRHAKSSWDAPGVADHDRPLSERGRRAAAAMAAHFRKAGIAPDLVLCSSARRTVDTLAAIRPRLPKDVAIETTADLYEVDAGTLLARVRRVPASVEVLLLVGHNPGMEGLATGLAGAGSDAAARAGLDHKFPAGALASLDFDGDWRDLACGRSEEHT